MKKKRSAYEIPYARVELTGEEKRQAIAWWQTGEDYPPLRCPVCGKSLVLPPRGATLFCPTLWCSYALDEIPWAVFVAFCRFRSGAGL